LISARKLTIVGDKKGDAPPEIIDPGLVGDVTRIDPDIILTLASRGFIPVIAPVGVGENGETFNINADLVASKVASALGAARLILLTDVDGVLDTAGKLISSINAATIGKMISNGTVTGGMIPKIEYALDAICNGIEKVQIINGKRRHSVLLELFTDKGIGTEVVA
jgi:acetylglutamate kinase